MAAAVHGLIDLATAKICSTSVKVEDFYTNETFLLKLLSNSGATRKVLTRKVLMRKALSLKIGLRVVLTALCRQRAYRI